ncbi:hypothetical protein OAM67_01025 [bacterium]|nr:hypothetical protein [bacterium]
MNAHRGLKKTARVAAAASAARAFHGGTRALALVCSHASEKALAQHGADDPMYKTLRDIAEVCAAIVPDAEEIVDQSTVSVLQEVHQAAEYVADVTAGFTDLIQPNELTASLANTVQALKQDAKANSDTDDDPTAHVAKILGVDQTKARKLILRPSRRKQTCQKKFRRNCRSCCFQFKHWWRTRCGCCACCCKL